MKAQIYFAHRQNQQITLIYGDGEKKKLCTISHTEPREHEMIKKLNEAILSHIPQGDRIEKLEASDDGEYIFVGMNKAIRIYNRVKE